MKSRKDTTRKLNLETLAKREVFAANVLASMALPVEKIETMIPAWHNVDMPSDVNRDGAITPMDALFRINSLNQDGARKLPASKPASAPFYDANGDDWLSPVDAIAVINELNKTPLTETVKQGLAGKGADVAEKVDQHNAKPNPGFTIAAESLAKINSIKPIHADNGTDDTEAEEQKLIKEMGWTKENAGRRLRVLQAQQELGLSDEAADRINKKADHLAGFGFKGIQQDLFDEIDFWASAEALGVDPTEAKKAGLDTAKDLWKTEGTLQEVGSPQTTKDIIPESISKGGGKQNTQKLVDKQVKNSVGQGNHQGSVEDALEAALRAQYGMGSNDTGDTTASENATPSEGTEDGTGDLDNTANSLSSDEAPANDGSGGKSNETEGGWYLIPSVVIQYDDDGDGFVAHISSQDGYEGSEHFTPDGKGGYIGSNGGYQEVKPEEGEVSDPKVNWIIPADTEESKFQYEKEGGKGEASDSDTSGTEQGESDSEDNNEESEDDDGGDNDDDSGDNDDDSGDNDDDSGEDDSDDDEESDETPNPQDEEVGEGRFLFGEGTIEGRRERANKKKEIASNSNGYGTSGPNPVADEKDSGGPVYNTGNHDDGNNPAKDKAESTGRIEDIVVKAGGGATDPHANTFAANVDAVMSQIGR